MSLTRQMVLAAAVAAASCGTIRAEEWTSFGSGSVSATQPKAIVPTQNLLANADNDADNVEIFHGRWRPYWRGYYHGSSGFAPRPNLLYGPIVYPRAYAFRPVYSSAVVYSPPCSCPSAVVMTSASPVSPLPSQSNPLPKTPPVPSESFYRYDGGPNSPIPPAGSFRPTETAEPPLAVDRSINRRVTTSTSVKPTQYAAYGENAGSVKSTTVLVQNR